MLHKHSALPTSVLFFLLLFNLGCPTDPDRGGGGGGELLDPFEVLDKTHFFVQFQKGELSLGWVFYDALLGPEGFFFLIPHVLDPHLGLVFNGFFPGTVGYLTCDYDFDGVVDDCFPLVAQDDPFLAYIDCDKDGPDADDPQLGISPGDGEIFASGSLGPLADQPLRAGCWALSFHKDIFVLPPDYFGFWTLMELFFSEGRRFQFKKVFFRDLAIIPIIAFGGGPVLIPRIPMVDTLERPANNLGVVTEIILNSIEPTAEEATVSFFKNDGTPLDVPGLGTSTKVMVPAEGSANLLLDTASDIQTGYAEVQGRVGTSAVFNTWQTANSPSLQSRSPAMTSNPLLLGGAGIDAPPPACSGVIRVHRSEKHQLNTAFAIVNPSRDMPLEVKLVLKRQPEDVVVATATLMLKAGEKRQMFFPEAFPGFDEKEFWGSLSFAARGPFVVITLDTVLGVQRNSLNQRPPVLR